jgi:hypothetical protein
VTLADALPRRRPTVAVGDATRKVSPIEPLPEPPRDRTPIHEMIPDLDEEPEAEIPGETRVIDLRGRPRESGARRRVRELEKALATTAELAVKHRDKAERLERENRQLRQMPTTLRGVARQAIEGALRVWGVR